MQLTHALKWSFLSEIASKAIQPLVFIVLARLLTPEDFGVVAAATMVISFSQIFWEAGMAKAIIQYQGERSVAANVAFWINNLLGILVAGLLIISADGIADNIFHDPRVAAVLQVMSLQVLLAASVSVHTALLQKDLQFKHLFWVRFATVTFPGLISIPMAWHGMGYWALVSGTIAGQIIQVLILWKTSLWKPSFSFDFIIANQLAHFGAWICLSGLLLWFYAWADSFIIGMYLGNYDLGLYRMGSQFTAMIYAMVFSPIAPVLYSYLSKINANKKHLGNAIEKVIKVITLTAIPIAFLVFSLKEPISDILFGEKWQGISLVIGALALMHGFSWVVGMNSEVYRAMGKPNYETIITSATLLIYTGAYLVSIKIGFEVFIWTRFSLAFNALILHIFILRWALSIEVMSIIKYLAATTALSSAIAAIIRFFILPNISDVWLQLMAGGTLNIIFLCAVIYIFKCNGTLKDMLKLTKPYAT